MTHDDALMDQTARATGKRLRSTDVTCPTCGAQPGWACIGSSRGRPRSAHHHRIEAAKEASHA